MKTTVPTLSLSGFVQDLPTMIDYMFSYYLTSDYSQSNLFRGQVVSLQKQIQQYQHSDIELTRRIREELEGYFNSVVDDANIEVSTDRPVPEDPNRINISLSAILIKDGKQYSVGRLIQTQDSKILDIIKLNNEG